MYKKLIVGLIISILNFLEHCAAIFGQKFWECRLVRVIQVQLKPEKFETKFLAFSKFRVFIVHGKYAGNLKIEKCFNILALRQLNVNVGHDTLSGVIIFNIF